MSAMTNKTLAAAALLALVLSTLTVLTAGCKADPHDTHVRSRVVTPR
jgi:hypothetical protein